MMWNINRKDTNFKTLNIIIGDAYTTELLPIQNTQNMIITNNYAKFKQRAWNVLQHE